MKKFILLLFLCGTYTAFSQENILILSGGTTLTNIEDIETNATGWRILGTYEFNPMEKGFSHGVSFGYIGTSTTYTNSLGTTEYKFNTFPIYYAPKFMFGNDQLKGYVKGALGMHFSNQKRTGMVLESSGSDLGFFGGAGAGVMVYINPKIFLNLEYEWDYLSNSYYRDGFLNTFALGLGFRF